MTTSKPMNLFELYSTLTNQSRHAAMYAAWPIIVRDANGHRLGTIGELWFDPAAGSTVLVTIKREDTCGHEVDGAEWTSFPATCALPAGHSPETLHRGEVEWQ